MANFCVKCGSRLDKATGLCPNCDAEKIKQYYNKLKLKRTSVWKEDMILGVEESSREKEPYKKQKTDKKAEKRAIKAQRKAAKKEKRAKWSTGKKIRRLLLKMVLMVIFFVMITAGVAGILTYFGIVDIQAVDSVFQKLGIYSNEIAISELYENYNEINNQALKIEEKYSTDGSVSIDQLPKLLKELSELADHYKNKGILKSYDLEETSIFMEFESGVGYFYTPTNREIMSGDQGGSILTVEPYATSKEFVAHYILGGKSPDKAAEKIVDSLPELYSFDSDHNQDGFSIEDVEHLGDNKIIIWYGHGGYIEEYGSVLGTSVPIKDKASLQRYRQELLSGEIILGKDYFCLSPAYFEKHIEDDSLNDCLVYLAACESGRDDRLADVFFSKGAKLVVGNTRSIFTRYNLYMMYDFITALTNTYQDGTFWTAEDALQYAKEENGETDGKIVFVGAEVRLIYSNHESEYRLKPVKSTVPAKENTLEETSSAFEKYLDAVTKTTESGSWSEQLALEADMSIAYDSGKTKTKMTLNSNSSISNYMEGDLSQIEISGLCNMKIMGQEYAWSTEYRDGIAHYQYTEPVQKSQDLEIDPNFFDFGTISYESIIDEEILGNQIRFTVSGEEITKTGFAEINQISGVNNLEYEDIDVIVTLGDSGDINEIIMKFNAVMEYQGYDADVTYDIQYTFEDNNNGNGLENILSEELLNKVRKNLKIPDTLDVEVTQSEKTYWDAGGCWLIHVEFRRNGKSVASADVNAETGDLIKEIFVYAGEDQL